jgi:hypothetical protein
VCERRFADGCVRSFLNIRLSNGRLLGQRLSFAGASGLIRRNWCDRALAIGAMGTFFFFWHRLRSMNMNNGKAFYCFADTEV